MPRIFQTALPLLREGGELTGEAPGEVEWPIWTAMGEGESLPARRRHGSLDSVLDHKMRKALSSITQDNVD